MNIILKTLGCRLNEAEVQTWARNFKTMGHNITVNESNADLVVLNTCAVTQEAVKKSRQLIRRIHRNNPQAKLVVSGCYASLNEKLSDEIEGIDLLVKNKDKDRLVEITNEVLQLPTMPSMATAAGEFSLFSPNRSRAFVKIQDGCRYRCTFCIVTVARGSERSREMGELVEEIKSLQNAGVKEVVLTGVHIGGYGSDHGHSLYELIETILKETTIPRLRLGSVEPWDLPDKFFSLFENSRFMPHLHLPLQSGCDSVLKRMARRCKTEDFQQLIEKARKDVKNFNVTTDIIVGFPGETTEEWRRSVDYIKSVGFSHLHIFSYSPREGTKAATMPNPVLPEIKKRRSQELHALAKKMKQSYLEKSLNSSVPVLWESKTEEKDKKTTCYHGYTPNFLRVKKTTDPSMDFSNEITHERIKTISDCGEILIT